MEVAGVKYPVKAVKEPWTEENTRIHLTGTEMGFDIKMEDDSFGGRLFYGFIPYHDYRYPQTVFFKEDVDIENGRGHIPVHVLKGKYDMVGWRENGGGIIGFRLQDKKGEIVRDGRFHFSGPDPLRIEPTIIEGPLVHCLGPDSVIISIELDRPAKVLLSINDTDYSGDGRERFEFLVRDLKPDQSYPYKVILERLELSFELRTAPPTGSRAPFTFAYASDSRHARGGGERKVHGANAYIMKKIAALALNEGSRFIQFTGDLVDGYQESTGNMNLQYHNWIQAVEPFWHYVPFNIGMGNHEAVIFRFDYPEYEYGLSVDMFPYDENSTEKMFADRMVNPRNGPDSEDGADYDPDPDKVDFPSYSENVYTYNYGNMAMVVINTDYWYAPSLKSAFKLNLPAQHDGGLHGYIMDEQLRWIEEELDRLERDPNIDHVFVTGHTPVFPNGGHVKDDMWYNGNNDARPHVSGKPLEKGIVERRDELLNICVNKSSKVRAFLTGDEHNYCRTRISPDMEMYPEAWELPKLELSRTVWQINNGAAGAPYYAQESAPWSSHTFSFSTQNALVFFDVEGEMILVRVINPDTLELIDQFRLH
jgi:hypothetical protein